MLGPIGYKEKTCVLIYNKSCNNKIKRRGGGVGVVRDGGGGDDFLKACR